MGHLTNSPPPVVYDPLQLLTLHEVAKLLGVHPKTVQRLYKSKQIKGVKLGLRSLKFRRHVVEHFIRLREK